MTDKKRPVSSKRYKMECRYRTGYEGRLEYRGEGRQGYRCKVAAILLLFVLTGMLAGCSGRMTPKRLLTDMEENMQNVTSSANHVEVAIQMEDVLDIRNVNMALDLKNTTQPPAGYAKGTAKVTIKNAQVSADLEIYQVQEDGKAVTYSRTNDSWVKETTGDSSESHLGVDGDIFRQEGKAMESFHLAKKSVKEDGKECYQMYGDVTGTELMSILGKDMVNAFHLVELPDEDAIRELKIPVIFEIYKDEMLPARILVDMSDVLNELYESYGETTKVNLYSIDLKFTDFDQVDAIEVPEEVKEAAGE